MYLYLRTVVFHIPRVTVNAMIPLSTAHLLLPPILLLRPLSLLFCR